MKFLCHLLLYFCLTVQADEDSQRPAGCKDIGYQYRYHSLKIQPRREGDRESLYFLYNRSSTEIQLYHMLGNQGLMNTFLNHTLIPKHWAVLVTGESDIQFICTKNADNQNLGKLVNCQSYLSVCEFPHTQFGINNRGNFWLVKADTRQNAIRQVERYGIIPQ